MTTSQEQNSYFELIPDRVRALQYTALKKLYSDMNNEFFLGELPGVIFIIDSGKTNVMGYFQFKKLKGKKKLFSVIAVNSSQFSRDPKLSAATILHEMCHYWEAAIKKRKAANGYHDKYWAEKMRSVGLEPILNNQARTSVSHKIKADGMFDSWWKAIPENARKNIFNAEQLLKDNAGKRIATVEYTCPKCGIIMRAERGRVITCTSCDEQLQRKK